MCDVCEKCLSRKLLNDSFLVYHDVAGGEMYLLIEENIHTHIYIYIYIYTYIYTHIYTYTHTLAVLHDVARRQSYSVEFSNLSHIVRNCQVR